VLYACDRAWWDEYHDKAHKRCAGEFWTTNDHAAKVYGLNFIDSEPGGGIASHPAKIRQGGNSGFQAVGLALLFGAARVILLGFDMQLTGRQSHWHGDHPNLGNPVVDRMDLWRSRFGEMAAQTSIDIVNATRKTALKCFPKVDLIESLAESSARGA
jgi:hypothetical protein